MQTNGYPEHIIKSFVAKKIKQFQALPKFGPQKCPVYLCLPLLSSVSIRFERQVKSAVKQCFSAVKPRVVCSTKELFTATKDLLPALQKSNVIYRFSCHCDSRLYLPKAAGQNKTRLSQIYPLLLFSRYTYFLPVGVILPPRLIPSLLLLIQPLDSIFHKILSVLIL